MDWGSLMSLSILGSVCSSVAIVLAVYMGIRYHQFLPKKAVYDSLEQLSHQLEEKREEYDDVRDSLSLAKNTIQEAEERQEYLARTRDEVQQLESKRREFQETQGQIESLQGQRRDLQASLDELTARQVETESRLQKQLAQILSPEEFERRKDEVQGLQRRHRELTESVANSESRSKELAARVSELNARVSDMTTDVEVLTVNKAGLVEAVSGLQARREQLEAQIEDLYHMRDAVAGPEGVAEASKVTELLWTPAVHKADLREGPGGITDELQALERAQELIQARGFRYHERVIKAFHTSLKCSEDAPLTVLAGISGTGKSALPRRYAEAMGMHFLTVPVQPGWDSPADIQGFYNHLERRYRPTELVRALLQMDPVHEGWPGWAGESFVGLKDRMLLVLLDEMNLARIEYYFSEFLSRLENRRGIDQASSADRKAAEIVLELGTMEHGTDDFRLFVGGNVLLVGTMNEDESTQALSDKVIDRSNVLRFGMPNKLLLESRVTRSGVNAAPALAHATWKAWTRFNNGLLLHGGPQVDAWIGDLNRALASVGRPFAHRVAAAMKSYVRNYPRVDDGDLQIAMADQVELRILPKLRGLDLYDPKAKKAITDVKQFVSRELRDDELANALETALNQSGDSLFHWAGVDREGVAAPQV